MTTPAEKLAIYSNQGELSSFFTNKVGIFSILSYANKEDIFDGVTIATTALSDAVTAAAVEGGILLIPTTENGSTYLIDDDITIPSNVTLWNIPGAILKGSAGTETLTINGGMNMDISQKFSTLLLAGTPLIDKVYPEWFGAVGTGIVGNVDDSVALNQAFKFGENKEIIFSDNKKYLAKDYLILYDGTYVGEGENSGIELNDTFVESGSGSPFERGMIYNVGYATTYNESTANKITFRNFKIYGKDFPTLHIVTLSNIRRFRLLDMFPYVDEWDDVTYPADDFYGTFDIRGCWSNLVIKGNEFTNYNGNNDDSSGNHLEITNWNADGSNRDNDCYNCTVEGNTFNKNVVDEWLWFNSAVGRIYNINIKNNKFYHYDNGKNVGDGGSGIAFRRGTTTYTNSKIENVTVDNNDFYHENLNTMMISCGTAVDNNTNNSSDNFEIINNNIYIDETEVSGSGSTGGILFDSFVRPTKAVARDNRMIAKVGMSEKCDYGIIGATMADNNVKIEGDFDFGLINCDKIQNNETDVTGKAMQNCLESFKDYLKGDTASVYRTTDDYYATETKFITDTGLNVVEAQANVPNVRFNGCEFSGASATRAVYSFLAPTSTFKFINCRNKTSGSAMLTTDSGGAEKILVMKGNELDSSGYDDFYDLGDDPSNLDTQLRLTAPIGHIVTDKSSFTRWQKRSTGSASANWLRIEESSILNGSTTYDPPSLADGAGVTTTVTVTSAALGDFASASFSNAQADVIINAWVSATNTVSVRFQNESGGVVDLASGTLRAKVIKA